jgi:hypothetical protein
LENLSLDFLNALRISFLVALVWIVYPGQGCARCVNVTQLREMFHATIATKCNARNASYNRADAKVHPV